MHMVKKLNSTEGIKMKNNLSHLENFVTIFIFRYSGECLFISHFYTVI